MKHPPTLENALTATQDMLSVLEILPQSVAAAGQAANAVLNNTALRGLAVLDHVVEGQAACQRETGLPPGPCLVASIAGEVTRSATEFAGLTGIGVGVATLPTGVGSVPGALAVSAGVTMFAHAESAGNETRRATAAFLARHQQSAGQAARSVNPAFFPTLTLSRFSDAPSRLAVPPGTLTGGMGLRVDPALQPFMKR